MNDTANGSPASGLTATLVKLRGGSQTDMGKSYPSTTQQPDQNGFIDFSPVPYGSYYLVVQTDEGHRLKKEFVIRPGANMDLTVVCPNDVPTGDAQLAVSFNGVAIPESIGGEVWTLCRIYQAEFTVWSATAGQEDSPYGGTTLGDDRWLLWEYETVLISPDGELYAVDWPSEKIEITPPAGAAGSSENGPFSGPWETWGLVEKLRVEGELASMNQLTLPVGQYTADVELVVLESPPQDAGGITLRILTDEERASVVFPESAEFVPNPMEVEAGSTAEWTIDLASLQTMCINGAITVVGRPENYAMENLGGFSGGFGGGGGFAGGGSGFF